MFSARQCPDGLHQRPFGLRHPNNQIYQWRQCVRSHRLLPCDGILGSLSSFNSSLGRLNGERQQIIYSRLSTLLGKYKEAFDFIFTETLGGTTGRIDWYLRYI